MPAELKPTCARDIVPLAAFTSAPAVASTGTSAACPFSAARLSAVQRWRSLFDSIRGKQESSGAT
eukprot:1256071-Prymnesium_polylepis.1